MLGGAVARPAPKPMTPAAPSSAPSPDAPADRPSRVLLLPGWQGSGPRHWQSLWEAGHGDLRVEQHDWDWPRRGDWMARLEEVLAAQPAPVRLAAHSLGCHLVAAWAAHTRHPQRVRGALLVAPPHLERPDLPPALAPWRPAVRRRLPFPAVAVLSDDDPYSPLDAAERLVADWGCTEIRRLPGRGHLNADSGLADWPEARTWLSAL